MFSILCKLARSALGQIKQVPQFAEGFHVYVAGLGCPDLAANRRIEHPERQLQKPTGISVFGTAVRHRYAAPNKRGVHTYSAAVPRMPRIPNLSQFNNMGAVLIACITTTERIWHWRKERL